MVQPHLNHREARNALVSVIDLPPVPAGLEDDRVISFEQAAAVSDVSVPTFRRIIGRNEGPRVTQLSPRRCGVRVKDLRAWLDSRRRR
jgi:predicted DNA-binding transcriptional regulator AlpA